MFRAFAFEESCSDERLALFFVSAPLTKARPTAPPNGPIQRPDHIRRQNPHQNGSDLGQTAGRSVRAITDALRHSCPSAERRSYRPIRTLASVQSHPHSPIGLSHERQPIRPSGRGGPDAHAIGPGTPCWVIALSSRPWKRRISRPVPPWNLPLRSTTKAKRSRHKGPSGLIGATASRDRPLLFKTPAENPN